MFVFFLAKHPSCSYEENNQYQNLGFKSVNGYWCKTFLFKIYDVNNTYKKTIFYSGIKLIPCTSSPYSTKYTNTTPGKRQRWPLWQAAKILSKILFSFPPIIQSILSQEKKNTPFTAHTHWVFAVYRANDLERTAKVRTTFCNLSFTNVICSPPYF